MEPTTGFTTNQPLLFIAAIFIVTAGIIALAYMFRLLFQKWDEARFELSYNVLKGRVLYDSISKDNFKMIELLFTEIKCTGMNQSKITALMNHFIGRFDRVNKYKGKTVKVKEAKDNFQIRLESRIETYVKELNEIIGLEEEAVKAGDRAKILLYRDNERITSEKLEELRSILNMKQ